jgi:hypothetical protein
MKTGKIFWVSLLVAAALTGCEQLTDPVQTTAVGVGTISGRALYQGGSSHAGIAITLDQTDGLRSVAVLSAARSAVPAGRSVAAATTTGDDGSYQFANVAAGTYTVYASSKDSTEKAVAVNVTVAVGQSVTAADLNLTATGSITGKVTLDGKTTGNLGFIVFIAGTSYMAMTADDGSFTISDIPAKGGYTVALTKGAYTGLWQTATVTVEAGKTAALAPKPLTSVDITGGGLQWQGSLAAAPANPQANWAYYNTADQKAYIRVGDTWQALSKDGADGKDGTDGNTPYIGENGNWWIGITDTGVKAQGDKGDTGATGQNGADGNTPHIGTNGNWWIGTTDTGVKAQGDKGDTGAAGQNGADGNTPYIGANGNWWIGTTDTGVKAQGIFTSIANITAYLNYASGGSTATAPIFLPMDLPLSSANWMALLDAIATANKYVSLDLSACTAFGTSGGGLNSDGTFDPDRTITTGKGRIVSLTLPDAATAIAAGGITNFSDSTFYNFSVLTTVTGAGVLTIGDRAFSNCTSLTSVSLPAVTTIGSNAFYSCSNLTSVSLPVVTIIGGSAFSFCTSLTNVSLPATATSIGG